MSRLFLVMLLLCGSASVAVGQRSVSATPQSLKVFRSVKGFEGEPIGVPTTIEFDIGALKYRCSRLPTV